ncbi:MAG TPA: L,D-transpeptidase family protein [Chitinophagaceae bacterium]|nr:L,D-transpeptidase family protein [Chitinophagaceae bacterium]
MKSSLLITAIATVFLFACNNSKEQSKNNNDEPEIENVDEPIGNPAKAKKVTDRDWSVTPENAYNNLFLDSMAMERYIENRQLADKKIARRIRSFYNARNYQYAWFSSDGVTEQTRFFWNQYDYAVSYAGDTTLRNSEFYKKVENVVNQEKLSVSSKDSLLRNTEFALTEYFIRYINSTYEKGYVKRKEQEKFIPIKKVNPLVMADSLLTKKHKDERYYENVNEMYGSLKKSLQLYYNIAISGGWPTVPSIKGTLKRGDENDAIPVIKKRLRMTLDMPGTDSSKVFTDTLETAVKKFQHRYGYKEDGIISSGLVKDMNVSARERVMQILLNMDRMRWMPQQPSGHLIIVNIPEFILHVYNGKEKVFDMVVVVGKVGHNTMMFNGDLNQIIFSPYWNVPASIIKNEINPAIARNPNYLASKNMERVGAGIRQKPGPGNALGKVKFIFPNSFNMYFHDTPSKSLFSLDKRAFSHGCIRLSEPQKMAEWLLRGNPQWNKEKIVAAMNKSFETPVKLKEPIPVFIIYYTAWVDEGGQLNFRDDVYDHDKELVKKMFTEGPEPTKIIRVDNVKAEPVKQ